MLSDTKTVRLNIGGMTCVSCQNRIQRGLRAAPGISGATVSWNEGAADITYDPAVISVMAIAEIIEKLDYKVLKDSGAKTPGVERAVGIIVIIVALYMLLQHFGILNRLAPSQLAEGGMGYGMLLVIGILTSVHCIAMCGGINLSQSMPKGGVSTGWLDAFMPSALYNLGRVISYTFIGFILGFAGLLFGGGGEPGLPASVQGILKIIAGAFMVIMGINMLGLFPALRRFQPRMPRIFSRGIAERKPSVAGPLVVGLLNGLMPCGPLQSMQIVALASGSPIVGALSMLAFSLGTVPLMLGLGGIVSALGNRFTHKVMTVGAVLVVVLGLAMLSQGGGLLNWNPWSAGGALSNIGGSNTGAGDMVDGVQVVNSTLQPNSYPDITVKAGVPVKWIINAPDGSINGCNARFNVYEYGIMNYSFKPGENVIEFMPDKVGRFTYTCWMGMIRASITVEE
ncbi:MAG: sulfite exporter TauE/SafE family protein [Oscillospiraceae bacterium]|jgi:sulfite exporter TauE/SafE/copper chaperone CopZ|nr:sulfite exporter TauE/SafE family protein [Oscillospiraceae bacterium]